MGLLKLKDYPHTVKLITSVKEEDGHNWLIANHFYEDWHSELQHEFNGGVGGILATEYRVYGFKDPALAAEFALRFA